MIKANEEDLNDFLDSLFEELEDYETEDKYPVDESEEDFIEFDLLDGDVFVLTMAEAKELLFVFDEMEPEKVVLYKEMLEDAEKFNFYLNNLIYNVKDKSVDNVS